MFKLDIALLDLVFPWSNYALYGFGIYAKFIILLFTFQQIVFLIYKKKGVNKK